MTNEIGVKLKNKLLSIYNDREFALGAMTNAKVEHWKELLEILETEELDVDRISLVALALGEK